jgi:hypothetical protein|uniref:Uncharacterized protein n=1 Tax=Leptospirillum ferriphilum TaxID=178606 RepID=A0A7C3LY90_9BACT
MRSRLSSILPLLAVFVYFLTTAGNALAWSWKLGDSQENILAVFHKGDPGLTPREGASTALPCGIYTDFDAHPEDRYLFFSPFQLSNGKYTPEFQFEFRKNRLLAVLVTAPYMGTGEKPYWTLNDILPAELRGVSPRVIHSRELKDKKGIQLPHDSVLIWDYRDKELQVLVFNLPSSKNVDWGSVPVAAYFRAYRNVLLDEGKTIPLPLKNPFMQ